MKNSARIGLLLIALALAACSPGRECRSHVTDGAHSEPCARECLSRDQYYKCLCDQQCPCWSSSHPGFP